MRYLFKQQNSLDLAPYIHTIGVYFFCSLVFRTIYLRVTRLDDEISQVVVD